jgi:hypothetical protein
MRLIRFSILLTMTTLVSVLFYMGVCKITNYMFSGIDLYVYHPIVFLCGITLCGLMAIIVILTLTIMIPFMYYLWEKSE